MPYSSEEKRDMLEIYYASHRNVQVTSETYLHRYPERRQPAQNYFLFLHRNLAEFGAFSKPKRQIFTVNDDEEEVLRMVSNCWNILENNNRQ